MTDSVPNRFTAMFEKTGVTEKKSKKKTIDFGAALGDDLGINETFRSLHEDISPSPAPAVAPIAVADPAPVVVPEPAVADVASVMLSPTPNAKRIASASGKKPAVAAPSDGLMAAPLHGISVSPSDSDTVKPLDRDTVTQLNGQTVTPLDHKTVTPSQPKTVSQPHHQTVSYPHTHHQTPSYYIPLDVLNLAYNQACVLENLIQNTTGITNARNISDQTGITIPSVREALLRLIAKGFMHKPVTVKNAAFQGFSYVLNKSLCDHFINAGGLGQENYNRHHQTVHQTVSLSNGVMVTPSNGVTIHSSSKSFQELKPTTTLDPHAVAPLDPQTLRPSDSATIRPSDGQVLTPSNGFILTGAVGAYWEEEGLGEGQALRWCQQFEVPADQMKQQLEWARFDLENNGRRGEVKKDTVSWFFGHLRTTGGCFPRPINYKSPAEIRAEMIEQNLEREKEAQAQLAAAEAEQRFQQILADPMSEEYQELFDQVNGFAKETGGEALIHALRSVYLGEEG